MCYVDYLNNIVAFLWHFSMVLFYGNLILRVLRKCVTWKKAVSNIYLLPYDTHIWILSPLTTQRLIKYQCFAKCIKLLQSIKSEISNSIVRECLSCVLSNSNTAIGYKLVFIEKILILVF